MENKDKFESDYATDVKTDQVSFFVIANNFVKRTPTLVVRELSFEPKLADYFENDRLFQITITE